MKRRYRTNTGNGTGTLTLVIIVCTLFLAYAMGGNSSPSSRSGITNGGNSVTNSERRTPTPTLHWATPIPDFVDSVAGDCDSSYPEVCIPPYPPDLDCGQISYRRFRVTGPDQHGFDGDNDGIGCERR